MQTFFLVFLPGLGAVLAGSGVAVWLTAKAYQMIHLVTREKRDDRLAIDSALLLKEICGSSADFLPPDLTERIERQIALVQATTRKELA